MYRVSVCMYSIQCIGIEAILSMFICARFYCYIMNNKLINFRNCYGSLAWMDCFNCLCSRGEVVLVKVSVNFKLLGLFKFGMYMDAYHFFIN